MTQKKKISEVLTKVQSKKNKSELLQRVQTQKKKDPKEVGVVFLVWKK